MDLKISNCWINFGNILVAVLGRTMAPEGNQKWDHFWNPVLPHLRGPTLPQIGIIRGVCKSYWNWNYTLQKKGSDNSLREPPPLGRKAKAKERKGKAKERLCWIAFGSILGQFCPILAQFVPSWGYLGSFLGPTWGYLGLLGAILSHLGAFLGPRGFQNTRSKNRCSPGSPISGILGASLGPKTGPFFVIFGVMFWTSFRTCFGTLFDQCQGHFLGPGARRARRNQEEPGGARRSQEEPGGARRSQEGPGGARGQKDPERARKSQEEPGRPGGARGQKEQRGAGHCWGPFCGKNRLQKGIKHGTTFGTTSPRISGVRGLRFQELYKRCGKALQEKKKGRDSKKWSQPTKRLETKAFEA